MIFYLTYNDAPTGIYSSQVIDVVKFIESETKKTIRLIAFVSIRNYISDKARIKSELPNAIVLPMFPKLSNWKMNSYLLSIYCKRYKPQTIIGRSVIATELALLMRNKKLVQKVVYDGRGAITAEWNEYNVVNDQSLAKEIEVWENEALLLADKRIAVSQNLVLYWNEKFQYDKQEHVVIPCTINKVFENIELSIDSVSESRAKFSFTDEDVFFVYSGSLAGWQSFDFLNNFLQKLLKQDLNHKVLFLSDPDNHIKQLQELFPKQVFNLKVNPNEVPNYLLAGDYGILLREQSITNKVASPVKYAEYLACGLKVVISDNLGDYTQLIRENSILGFVFEEQEMDFDGVQMVEKIAIRNFALSHFTKNNFVNAYNYLLK